MIKKKKKLSEWKWGVGYHIKEGGGTRQRTRVGDPWTWIAVWGLTGGLGVGSVEEGKGGKLGTTVIE